jgi:thiol:disulfide interchange protein DsbD
VRLFAFILAFYGISLFVGALSGAKSMLHPFEGLGSTSDVSRTNVPVDDTFYNLETLLNEIQASQKPVIVYFTKDACIACKELKEFTFSNKEVAKVLEHYRFITVDVTRNLASDKEILRYFDIFGTPNILFFDTQGEYMPDKTITGFVNSKRFLMILEF